MRWRATGGREDLEQCRPDALLRPPHEPVVECLARPIFRRSIYPAASGLQDVNDPTDDASIINARLSSRIGGQVRRYLLELLVRQPEQIPIHSRSLSEAVNHNSLITPTILWVWSLAVCCKTQWLCQGMQASLGVAGSDGSGCVAGMIGQGSVFILRSLIRHCDFPPRGVRVRPCQGRTDEASTFHGRADHRHSA